MDMKKILQAFDGAATKPVQGASDMKKFMSIVRENANPYTEVKEAVVTGFEEGSVGGDANAFLLAADNINDEVMAQINKIKINADEKLLKDLLAKFNEFMTAYHAVGKEILQPDLFDNTMGEGWGAERQQRELDAANAKWREMLAKYEADPKMSEYLKMFRVSNWTPEKAEVAAKQWIEQGKPLPKWYTNPTPVKGYTLSGGTNEGLSIKDYFALAEARKDPCWKDYKQVGMKTKGGKKVPNCVPKK